MLWGALNNSSTAMMAFSTDMGSISQNISNVNTTGYKRTETMFKTMMSEHHAAPNTYVGGLNIFGVQAVQRNHIQAQGIIQPSNTWSDLAINGKGFFMVAPPVGMGTSATVPGSVDLTDPDAVYYTRDGAWSRSYGPDTDPTLARNYFTTASGNYLMGWMADDRGEIGAGRTLEPVYTLGPRPIANNGTPAVDNASTARPSSILMPGRATSAVSVRANLPSQAPLTSPTHSSTMNAVDAFTGLSHPVTLDWQRVDGNTWTVTPSIDAAVGTVASGPFTVETDPYGVVYQPVPGADAIDITWASDGSTSTTSFLGATNHTSFGSVLDPNGASQTVQLDWVRVSGNTWDVIPTMGPGVGTVTGGPLRVSLDGSGKIISPTDKSLPITIDWDDTTYAPTPPSTTPVPSTDTSLNLANLTPTSTVDAPSAGVEKIPVELFDATFEGHEATLAFERAGVNTWYLHIQGDDGSQPGEPIQLVFDGKGQLTSPTMPLNVSFNWLNNGAPVTTPISLDLSKLSQYNGSSTYIGGVTNDGYGEGTLISTAFTETGELQGYYTNGRSRTLFKIPVANFVSEDALDPVSGNLFRRTLGAGEVVVSAIEEAEGEGRFVTSSLESSTVQIEDEFTRMIMTQKAYSSNAQVFKTADEMTSTARDLKR